MGFCGGYSTHFYRALLGLQHPLLSGFIGALWGLQHPPLVPSMYERRLQHPPLVLSMYERRLQHPPLVLSIEERRLLRSEDVEGSSNEREPASLREAVREGGRSACSESA